MIALIKELTRAELLRWAKEDARNGSFNEQAKKQIIITIKENPYLKEY